MIYPPKFEGKYILEKLESKRALVESFIKRTIGKKSPSRKSRKQNNFLVLVIQIYDAYFFHKALYLGIVL